jgi:trigger factor
MMKILSKEIENSQAIMTIELESDEVEKALDNSYRQLNKATKIPGFRKGKTPRNVLETHVGSNKLFDNALKELLPQACNDAIVQEKLSFIGRPNIKLAGQDPVIFEATFPLPPKVKLGDYRSIRMKPELIKVKKKDVDRVLERLLHQNATWEPVKRPVVFNDLVTIDVDSDVEGKPIYVEKQANYKVTANSYFPAKGFPEQLVGMKVDEQKDFKLLIPQSYNDKDLAGKDILFTVKLLEIKTEKLPKLDDSFAKGITPGIEGLDSLKEKISQDLKTGNEQRSRLSLEEKLLDTLISESELEFPPLFVDNEVDQMVNQYMYELTSQSSTPEQYMELVQNTDRQRLADRYRPIATKRVSGSLVLSSVAEAEKIEVSDTDIDAEIERLITRAGDKQEEQRNYLNSPNNRTSVKNSLASQRAMQRIVEIASKPARKTRTKKEVK